MEKVTLANTFLEVDVLPAFGAKIHLNATGISLPFQFNKVLCLCGSSLQIGYRLTNIGTKSWPYVWSAHPLFTVSEGDRIVLPNSVTTVKVESSIGSRLEPGSIHSWPKTRMSDGRETDLGIAGGIHACTGDMLFTKAPVEGWAALERVRESLRIELRFDLEHARYLGLWLCFGGWPEGKGPGNNLLPSSLARPPGVHFLKL